VAKDRMQQLECNGTVAAVRTTLTENLDLLTATLLEFPEMLLLVEKWNKNAS
jgi:hypothetical protein